MPRGSWMIMIYTPKHITFIHTTYKHKYAYANCDLFYIPYILLTLLACVTKVEPHTKQKCKMFT